MSRERLRVLVRGAGVVGLSVAEELLRRGHDVVVVDPAPARGASHAAAGMLSPSSEVWWGEEALLDLGLRSLRAWPGFAERLGVPLHRGGTLLVGADHGDLQQVQRQVALLAGLGAPAQMLAAADVREREPRLARVAGGAWLPGDHAVDPRALCAALLRRVPVRPALGDDPGQTGVDVEVLATGARLPAPYAGLVRGVRGEILRVRTDDPPASVVRGWVRGEPVYLVPRPSGAGGAVEVVVGATSEEHDAAPVVSVGGVARLLDAARTLVPGLDRAELVETCARDRPAAPDHLPLIGPAPGPAPGTRRVVLAAGHYRHGVLLAPLTAVLVADHLERGCVDAAVDPRRLEHLMDPHEKEDDDATHRER